MTSKIDEISTDNELFNSTSSVIQMTSVSTEKTNLSEKDLFFSRTPESQTTFQFTGNLIFDEKNLNFVMNLMTSEVDMNACLINCSGNGKCKMVNSALYSCECFDNYSGSSCQLNTLACSSNPCRNNATCENNLSDKTYKCECHANVNQTSLYYGQNCENKIDVCQNETCSNKGVCNDLNDEKICKCFAGYSGDKCEIESDDMKVAKSVITVASIIAIIIIASFFLCIILSDLSNLVCKKQ